MPANALCCGESGGVAMWPCSDQKRWTRATAQVAATLFSAIRARQSKQMQWCARQNNPHLLALSSKAKREIESSSIDTNSTEAIRVHSKQRKESLIAHKWNPEPLLAGTFAAATRNQKFFAHAQKQRKYLYDAANPCANKNIYFSTQ